VVLLWYVLVYAVYVHSDKAALGSLLWTADHNTQCMAWHHAVQHILSAWAVINASRKQHMYS
jgi:hypothetical protein